MKDGKGVIAASKSVFFVSLLFRAAMRLLSSIVAVAVKVFMSIDKLSIFL